MVYVMPVDYRGSVLTGDRGRAGSELTTGHPWGQALCGGV